MAKLVTGGRQAQRFVRGAKRGQRVSVDRMFIGFFEERWPLFR